MRLPKMVMSFPRYSWAPEFQCDSTICKLQGRLYVQQRNTKNYASSRKSGLNNRFLNLTFPYNADTSHDHSIIRYAESMNFFTEVNFTFISSLILLFQNKIKYFRQLLISFLNYIGLRYISSFAKLPMQFCFVCDLILFVNCAVSIQRDERKLVSNDLFSATSNFCRYRDPSPHRTLYLIPRCLFAFIGSPCSSQGKLPSMPHHGRNRAVMLSTALPACVD